MPLNDYITLSDLQDRLSAQVVQSIYDDNNDGTPDTNPVARLIKDACSKVNGYLFPVYSAVMNDASQWNSSTYPDEVKRLTLDVFEALAARRHPEAVKRDWVPLMQMVESELTALRKGVTRLNVTTLVPETVAANAGGTVRSGDPLLPTPKPKMFADGTGDF